MSKKNFIFLIIFGFFISGMFLIADDSVSAVPTLTTASVSGITTTMARSGGDISSDGGVAVTSRGVCWSESTSPSLSDSYTTNGDGTGSYSSFMTGLTPATLYYVRAYATNADGTSYGGQESFTTLPASNPTVTTSPITNITGTDARSGGDVTSDGGATVTSRGVCWSTSSNPTTADNTTSNGSGVGSFSSYITGLTPAVTYHVRAYATNSAGTSYGSDLSFTTTSGTLPTITTAAASNIAATSAVSGGDITSDGGSAITDKGVCWSTSADPTVANAHISNHVNAGSFISDITNLIPLTTYYVRAYATNSVGTSYGNNQIFTTAGGLPIVTTNIASVVSLSGATLNGTINANNNYTTVFFEYGTTTSYGTDVLATPRNIDGYSDVEVTYELTNLLPNTTYYYRLVGRNSVGRTNGQNETFTTWQVQPDITITNPVNDAIVNGTVHIIADATISVNQVEFFIDDVFLGNGVLELKTKDLQENSKTMTFDITNSMYLFIDKNNQLKKISNNGSVANVFSEDVGVEDIQLNSTGEVFINLKETIKLNDYNLYKSIKIDIFNKLVYGIETVEESKQLSGIEADSLRYDISVSLNRNSDFEQKIEKIFDIDNKELILLAYDISSEDYSFISTPKYNYENNFKTIVLLKERPKKIIKTTMPLQDKPLSLIDINYIQTEIDDKFASNFYTIDWDTMDYSDGTHKIKVTANDEHDRTFSDEIEVLIQNFQINLNVIKKEDRTLTFKVYFGELTFSINNPKNLSVEKYVIYKSTAGGEFVSFKEITTSDIVDNKYTYHDTNIDNDTIYSYKIVAFDSSGNILSESEIKRI